jgi:RNA polymerase sigma-70 factor, ECF subfamily
MFRRGDTLLATPSVARAREAPGVAARLTGAPQPPGDPVALGALVERAQAGDRAAFGQLVERSGETAFRTARAILGSEADARDATQEAFLSAWRERRGLRDPARFDAWFGRILVNSCRQVMRGRRRRSVREITASDLADPVDGLVGREPAPEERSVSIDTVERAFERLAAPERAILVLHHLEHRPLDDIALTLDVPVGTVKSRLHAARQSLERALEAELR